MEQYRDEEWLRDKYWNKKLSMNDIADICGCCCKTVYNWMEKYDIPRRDFMIYPDLESSPTLSYILGVVDSDGCVYLSCGRGNIKLNVVDKEFADSFYDALQMIGCNPCRYVQELSTKDQYYIEATSIKFYKWYTSLDVSQKRDIVEKHPKMYLRGFYEGDGHQSDGHLGFTNTNLGHITLIESLLDNLGFTYSRTSEKPENSNYKIIYRVNILGGISERNRFLDKINPCIRDERYE